jgi:hypothetical protein
MATTEQPTRSDRTELLRYALAIVTYIPLGVFVRTAVLNWIIGPLYFVMVVSTVPRLLAGKKRGDP